MSSAAVDSNMPVRRMSLRPWLVAVLVALAGLTLLGFAGREWTLRQAQVEGERLARDAARAHVGLFNSELQKYRLLPVALIEYPDVHAALGRDDPSGSAAAAARLNIKLELLAQRTGAAVIYLLDQNGRTVAASNWRLPTSFVRHEYGFRPYFRDTMRNGRAEQFALGAVSQRPGLFLAQKVAEPGQQPGVIVVKVEFDAIENDWRHQAGHTIVIDANGVVVLSSRAEWRFKSARYLAAGASLRSRGPDGTASQLPISAPGGGIFEDGEGQRYVDAREKAPMAGWTLLYLEPLDPIEAVARNRLRVMLLATALLFALLIVLIVRIRERRAMQESVRRFLETEVERRTADLVTANEQIRIESQERELAAMRLRQSREELAQANRLGTIGQITAGVAHEINQPIAAIRTFAENSARLIERGQSDGARTNLAHIVDLTSRVGAITAELRNFARRGTPAIASVSLHSAIQGALLLLGDRLRVMRVQMVLCETLDSGLVVIADRVRLEQVVINIVQNALDALKGVTDPVVTISVALGGENISVLFSDNGPGVSPNIVDTLFTPFVTSKSNGMGLGLAIARDIAREFGGDLSIEPSAVGAAFILTLKRA